MLKNINIGLAALVLGFGLTITTSAFKNAPKNRADVQWNFLGTSTGQANDQTKYSMSAPSPTECGSDDQLPCYILTPESVDTQAELHDYFVSTYGDSAPAIDAAAAARRAAQ